ncbi:unnamed protein product [Arctia plantaginis]|uniref:Uncharacterized protein n=1 Tax=Arctia plantaginis TaxID=874455 RepID=A0A8S0Z138_ARCPL|nr:unnamed protein product [Arctia plantaginis]
MDPDRIAEEIRAKMIRYSLIEPEIASQAAPVPRKRRSMLDYQRRLKKTKLKIVATDSMIRKVRAGELDLVHLKKEVIGPRDKNWRSRRDFIKKLEVLAKLTEREHSENESRPFFEIFDTTEDQKAILLLNKMKRCDTLRKEGRLLLEVIFGKNITREHIDLLQKEYMKCKPDMKNII